MALGTKSRSSPFPKLVVKESGKDFLLGCLKDLAGLQMMAKGILEFESGLGII